MKKIFIILIVVVFVIGIYCSVVKALSNKKEDYELESILENSVEDNIISKVLEDEIMIGKFEDETNQSIEIEEENLEESKEQSVELLENNTKQVVTNSKMEVQKNEPKQSEEQTEIVTEIQVQESEHTTIVYAQIPEQQETQEPENTEEKIEITTQQSQNIETKEEGEKYVRNDAMIDRIRDVINNNESEYMKSYGYTVEVDASIKEHTNQFTFTENRVKAFITYKFGTIRIYAEDYYRNGQFIMTECYIF